MPDELQQAAPNWLDNREGGVTTETAPRHMKFVRVAVSELEDLKTSNSTLELAFFGISLGAFLTIVTTVNTVDFTDAATRAVYVALAFLFGFASLYFAAATVRGELRWRRKINDLKGGPAAEP